MKTLKTLSLAVAVSLLMGALGFAQTTLTQTTLASDMPVGPQSAASGAQGNFTAQINLTSATGVTAAFNGQPVTWAFVDQELMGILTLAPGQTTIFNVLRAQQGTKAAFHKTNAVVYLQVGSPQFGGFAGSGGLYLSDPPIGASCLGSATLATPWINIATATQFICGTYQTPAGNVITGWIPASEYLWPMQNSPFVVYSTGSYANATTTFSNVSGLSFPVQANRNYHVVCRITWQGSANTTGPKYQFTGPSSPTAVAIGLNSPITASTAANASATAFSSAVANTGTITATTNFTDVLSLDVLNGANAGTVQLQAAANGAGTLTIQNASSCGGQ